MGISKKFADEQQFRQWSMNAYPSYMNIITQSLLWVGTISLASPSHKFDIFSPRIKTEFHRHRHLISRGVRILPPQGHSRRGADPRRKHINILHLSDYQAAVNLQGGSRDPGSRDKIIIKQ